MTIAIDLEKDPLNTVGYQRPVWSYIIVHHTGAEEKNTEQIRQYHKSLGWRDIGYHFVIERDGKVVNGRSLDLPGAHCTADKMNFRGIGIALIGNFMNHPPTEQQVTSLIQHLLKLRRTYNIPKDHILGHKQVRGAATNCPGKYFPYSVLTPVRLLVNGRERHIPIKIVNGRTHILVDGRWVQLVPIVEQLGGTVKWIAESKTVDVRFS